ncbi:MAG: choice-of-anchor R domain-containing protein [Verrucomicrobiales bacterium]
MTPLTRSIRHTAFAACAAGIALAAFPVQAATVSLSTTAPTVDGADIANLDLGTSFADFGTSFLWTDRPARGQTFVTGADPNGYTLSGITLIADRDALETASYTIRIGTVTGTAFSPVASETATIGMDIIENDYVSFILDTPIALDPSTTYGFDAGLSSPDGGFSNHGWALLNNPGGFAGGTAYNSGGSGVGGATISSLNQDRLFHLDIAAVPAVPEPSRALLACLGGLGLIARRRRFC